MLSTPLEHTAPQMKACATHIQTLPILLTLANALDISLHILKPPPPQVQLLQADQWTVKDKDCKGWESRCTRHLRHTNITARAI